jgi:hypothetical protein
MVSHTRLMLATNELMHVLMLPTSSSLDLKVTSKYTSFPTCLVTISLVILVFLVLVSEKGGSTSIALREASAYFKLGNGIDIELFMVKKQE